MQNTQLEVLQAALSAMHRGAKVTLVSVIKTFGTSPRPVGSLLMVSSDGHIVGSVSGGCIEDDLMERLVNQPPEHCELLKYGESEKERHHFGLPCGGSLDLLLEPLAGQRQQLQQLIERLEQRQTCVRWVNVVSGATQLKPYHHGDIAQLLAPNSFDSPLESHSGGSTQWVNVFGPVWRLLIIGAGQTSRYLAEMANALGYRVLISDPRTQYRRDWNLPYTELLEGYPDDVVREIRPDERTAIVALTHDPKLDDLALLEGLTSEAFYIGALGSFNTNRNRRQRLQEHFGFTESQLQRLQGPVGLPIGSKTPPEIALAVMAELTALKNGVDLKAQLSAH